MKTWPAPQPGDFACVPISGDTGKLIGVAEHMCGDKFSQYQHAFVYLGDGKIVEAEPGGARVIALPRPYEPWARGVLWSTGKFPAVTPEIGQAIATAAQRLDGTPYSFLDYAALAAHHAHVPAPGLARFIGSEHHMICSQLVDYAYHEAGVRLFSDGRWPGYVMPADLAALIMESASVAVDFPAA